MNAHNFTRENRQDGTVHRTKTDVIKIKDIQNIVQKFKKCIALDPDDAKSLSLLVSMWNEEPYSPVLIFKPKGCPIQIGPKHLIGKHEDERFIFGFQTETQKNVMRSAKDDMLFMDGTHGTNEEGLQLFNVLAVTKDQHGFPTAFFLISHKDIPTYTLCLDILLDKSGYIPKVIHIKIIYIHMSL